MSLIKSYIQYVTGLEFDILRHGFTHSAVQTETEAAKAEPYPL